MDQEDGNFLPDHSPLDDAVNYILLTLRKSPTPNTPETCRAYTQTIQQQTGVSSIGELRVFTDADFKSLQVPAMLRIYLKYLVRGTQSGRTLAKVNNSPSPATSPAPISSVDAFMTQLQNDFNYGQSFDMSQYKANLDTLAIMGFTQNQAMEALCIVENKNVEAACELLLASDSSQRKEKRIRVVERLGRQVKSDALMVRGSSAVVAAPPAVPVGGLSPDATLALQNELALVRAQASRERNARLTQSQEYKSFIETTLPLKIYSEYLKSLLVKEYILPIEMEQLNKYRTRNGIDMKAHCATLMELGIESVSALDSLVKKVDKNKGGGPGAGGNIQQPGDLDCVVCLDKPKSYVITNCMHLCLCEDCANSWMKHKGQANTFNKNCPICSKKITQIMRIYL